MSEEDKQRPRPPAEKKRKTQDGAEAPAELAREVVSLAADAAREGHASVARSAGPLTADPPQQANNKESDITKEAQEAGPVFGEFLKSVGFAVAETQAKLDETFRETAKALSDQDIEVIAVFEQSVNENGRMEAGKPHIQKLPLINYVMPTIQEISHCSISADMKVREFSSGSGFQIQGKSQSVSAGVNGSYGMFGGSISGHFGYNQASAEAATASNYADDEAVGTLHLETTIQPRETVQLPKPFITQTGPSLKLNLEKTTPVMRDVAGATPDAPKKQLRSGTEALIRATLVKSDGQTALAKKPLEVSVDQPLVTRDLPDGSTTNDQGEITVKLTRDAGEGEYKPLETTVRVWMGLVSQTIVLAL